MARRRIHEEAGIHCRECGLYRLCLSCGGAAGGRLGGAIEHQSLVKHGVELFRKGAPFRSIYAIRNGSVKTCVRNGSGREQIAGFHLPGELLGLDAIGSGHYRSDAITLEQTVVCALRFASFEALARKQPGLHRQMLLVMSKQMEHDRTAVLPRGKTTADALLAAFLLNLFERHQRRGIRNAEFRLSMSRGNIADYLGLAQETVSRVVARFRSDGLVSVDRRHVHLLDLQRLGRLAEVSIGSGNGVEPESGLTG